MARLNFILLAALTACALALVTSQHQARKLYVELQKEQDLAKQLEVEWGQLQLEQSTWATHARIEKIAARELPQPRLKLIGRATRPPAAEVAANPRARSAVMRVAERTGG